MRNLFTLLVTDIFIKFGYYATTQRTYAFLYVVFDITKFLMPHVDILITCKTGYKGFINMLIVYHIELNVFD